MTWALITMLCMDICVPVAVDLFDSLPACTAQMDPKDDYHTEYSHCVIVLPQVKK